MFGIFFSIRAQSDAFREGRYKRSSFFEPGLHGVVRFRHVIATSGCCLRQLTTGVTHRSDTRDAIEPRRCLCPLKKRRPRAGSGSLEGDFSIRDQETAEADDHALSLKYTPPPRVINAWILERRQDPLWVERTVTAKCLLIDLND